jgi:hypothetical protein
LVRTDRLRWANFGEPGIVFDMSAYPIPGGYIGQLQIHELDGRFTQRSVQGTNCDAVINALAFVGAVLVDPDATASSPELPRPTEAPITSPPEFAAPSKPKDIAWGLGVGLGVNSAPAPTLTLDPGIRGLVNWDGPVFSPWLALGWDYRPPSGEVSPGLSAAKASIKGWTTYVAFSPIRWPGSGRIALRPNVLFEVGSIGATNVHPNNGQNHNTWWLAIGLGVTAELKIYHFWGAFLDAGIDYPLSRPEFVFTTGGSFASAFQVRNGLGEYGRLGTCVKFE